MIHLNKMHFPVTALGPGERIGIWVQGCSLRCPGCISQDTWERGTGGVPVSDVMAALEGWLPQADGITISGGEPFEQPEALVEILESLREVFRGDILVFSGFDWEQLQREHGDLLGRGWIDGLISGPYRQEAGQSLPLRGSDNQELHLLTTLGHERFTEEALAQGRRLDVFQEGDGLWFAGIPAQGDWEQLQAVMAGAGVDGEYSHQRKK